ncbi:transcriptional regulator [Sphingorhabdus pulchriflava]|uniref:Nitrogen regulatory protein P-II n=1 Tax=Sphingorhabdus pulchriflava TaxID=2292257 RepID=A0A371BGV6_9SPHN|nr:transcriptional regulator [Sphingorhabdus pulchriflava]RDV06834.1 transcriptional regulator [Sphingorhabdus pulchriflava]
MVETVARKRIEILVDTPLVPRLLKHAREVDISGWSLIHVDAGGGRDGAWQHDDVTGAAAKTIILMIASEAKAAQLVDALAPLLDSYRLLLTVGDVQVVRGERF